MLCSSKKCAFCTLKSKIKQDLLNQEQIEDFVHDLLPPTYGTDMIIKYYLVCIILQPQSTHDYFGRQLHLIALS